jgi:hypothetical protein
MARPKKTSSRAGAYGPPAEETVEFEDELETPNLIDPAYAATLAPPASAVEVSPVPEAAPTAAPGPGASKTPGTPASVPAPGRTEAPPAAETPAAETPAEPAVPAMSFEEALKRRIFINAEIPSIDKKIAALANEKKILEARRNAYVEEEYKLRQMPVGVDKEAEGRRVNEALQKLKLKGGNSDSGRAIIQLKRDVAALKQETKRNK